MLRFVDLRPAGIANGRFCFYDTVINRFINAKGTQVWNDWEEFKEDFQDFALAYDLERLRGLCPPWVFEKDYNDDED